MVDSNFIEFHDVTKVFGNNSALNKVNFKVQRNSIVGLLGPNGSGKSTLMKILGGLIIDWKGDILLEGKSIKGNQSILGRAGFLIEDPSFYEYLNAKENLEILARLTKTSSYRISEVLKMMNLLGSDNKRVSEFSYGMKQRLGIAQAIIHDPDILFLDEPNNGLDPVGIIQMNETIKNLNNMGKTIFISTHILDNVRELCTHIAVLNSGKLILYDSIKDLIKNSKRYVIKSEKAKELRNHINTFKDIEIAGFNNYHVIVDTDIDLHELVYKISTKHKITGVFKDLDITRLFN